MLTDLDFIWEIVDPVNTKLREFEEGGQWILVMLGLLDLTKKKNS